MANKRIVYYTVSDGCTPCEEIGKLIGEGKFSSPDTNEIDMVDIGTDEGFASFAKDVLAKDNGGVPSAYLDGKKCRIEVDDDMVFFECSKADRPADPDGKSSPPESGEKHSVSPPDPQAYPPESQL